MDCSAEDECERVEEHILLCASCRKHLDECDRWVALIKAAAAQVTTAVPLPFWQKWWQGAYESLGSPPLPLLAGGFAMLLGVLWIAPSAVSSRVAEAGQPIGLSALRGNDLRVTVRAGRALDLKVEDADGISASIVIVNADGDRVWSGTLQGNSAHVPSLKKGVHWVRLISSVSGQQLKEYGLLVE